MLGLKLNHTCKGGHWGGLFGNMTCEARVSLTDTRNANNSLCLYNPTERLVSHSQGSVEGPQRVVKNQNLLSHPDDLKVGAYVTRMTQ